MKYDRLVQCQNHTTQPRFRPQDPKHPTSGGTSRRRSGIWKPFSGEEATSGRVTMLNITNSPVRVPETEKKTRGNVLGALFNHDIVIDREL